MWSLGMILHKLIFFRLPYPEIDAADKDGIEREVLAYPGWKANPDIFAACKRRGLPRAILVLLEGLLNRNPRERPTSERVLHALREGTVRYIIFFYCHAPCGFSPAVASITSRLC
jgi:hypothetical protein